MVGDASGLTTDSGLSFPSIGMPFTSPPPLQLAAAQPVAAAPVRQPAQKTTSVKDVISDAFRQAGYPEVAIEGITRRQGFEGGDDPAKMGDNYSSVGAFQWHGERMQTLLNYAKQTGQNPIDPKVQAQFALKETNANPALKSRLMNAKTPEEAYDIWTQGFENPANPYDHGPGGLNLPGVGALPDWMMGSKDGGSPFLSMQRRMMGEQGAADEHLRLARSAEAQMLDAAPKPTPTPPAQQWGSLAMGIAALGGLLTKTPVTTAMNAMAGVINAFHANDLEAAKSQFQQWKASHDALIKVADLEIKQYEAAMKELANEPRALTAALAAQTAAFKNEYANKLFNEGKTDQALQVLAGYGNTVTRVENAGSNFEAQAKLAVVNQYKHDHPNATDAEAFLAAEREFHAAATPGGLDADTVDRMVQMQHPDWDRGKVIDERNKILSSSKKPLTGTAAKEDRAKTIATQQFINKFNREPDESNFDDKVEMARLTNQSIVEAGGVLTDEAAEFAAKRVVLGGDERALTGMARSAANITKLNNFIVKVAKDAGLSPEQVAVRVAQFQGITAGERTLGTRQANMEVAANEAKAMSPLALEASDKVDRTQYPSLNSVLLAAERGTGNEDVVRFALAANSLIYSFSKFLNPTGIPTDADKARATEILSTAWSKGQFKVALDQIDREIKTGRFAIDTTREEFLNDLIGKMNAGQLSTAPAAGGGGAHPEVPATLHDKTGLQWSSSRRQWRDASGHIYNADGSEAR